MKIINPSCILKPDGIVYDMAVAFDKQIAAVAPIEDLLCKYPDAELIECKENTLLMPGLINTHVHLEFCANRDTLKYGSFVPWLYSVIEHREELISKCDTSLILQSIDDMLHSGTTAFAAVSSYGLDLKAASMAPQKVLFFNEVIGSQAQMADALYADFESRLESSLAITRDGFKSGVAIHSPYSVHPALIGRALRRAKEQKLLTTAHFLESKAEKEWLESASGEFGEFFDKLLQQKYSVNNIDSFLDLFAQTPTLMTHVTQASASVLKKLKKSSHTVIHCPISNRLLGNGAVEIDELDKEGLRWVLGSDGLSSNYSLNLFEEMKIALFMHSDQPLESFAQKLLNSATIDASDALGFNSGAIEQTRAADMLLIELPQKASAQSLVHLLIQHHPIVQIYIDGEPKKETYCKV